MLALLAIALLAYPPDDAAACARTRCPHNRESRQTPAQSGSTIFLEFAPDSGVGLTAECAGTSVTDNAGNAVHFLQNPSHPSVMITCTKGPEFSGITPGNVVKLPNGSPRVMRGGDGTGDLGLMVEGRRANYAFQTEAFDNASWLKLGSGAAAPTVTANAGTAPDGTSTAERVQFAATTGAQYSLLFLNHGCGSTGSTLVSSVYAMSNTAGSQYIDICFTPTDTTTRCAPCTVVPNTYTRCYTPSVASVGLQSMTFGNHGLNDGGSRASSDVLVWGAQCEASSHGAAFLSSYIPNDAGTEQTPAERGDDIAWVRFPVTVAPRVLTMSSDVWVYEVPSETSSNFQYVDNGTVNYRMGLLSGWANNNPDFSASSVLHMSSEDILPTENTAPANVGTLTPLAFNHVSGGYNEITGVHTACLNSTCVTRSGLAIYMRDFVPTGGGYMGGLLADVDLTGTGAIWFVGGDYGAAHMSWGVTKHVCLKFGGVCP